MVGLMLDLWTLVGLELGMGVVNVLLLWLLVKFNILGRIYGFKYWFGEYGRWEVGFMANVRCYIAG
ncbi:hypothetical protein [Candidatus Hodgkinia cicadicola]|uniref:hypothetical protein n=1 Tax=Candidatus Hodgkinia cicadicola TaxID=573658 RepID=UPI001788D462